MSCVRLWNKRNRSLGLRAFKKAFPKKPKPNSKIYFPLFPLISPHNIFKQFQVRS